MDEYRRNYILENINMLDDYLDYCQKHLEHDFQLGHISTTQRNEDMSNLDRLGTWLDTLRQQYKEPFCEIIFTPDDLEFFEDEVIGKVDYEETQEAMLDYLCDHLHEFVVHERNAD